MNIDINEGLFRVKTNDGWVFFRPTEITVYSCPPPVYVRLVTYKMTYWLSEIQPADVETLSQSESYVNYDLGLDDFSFTMAYSITDKSKVLDKIRAHFTSVVLNNKRCRSIENGLGRIRDINRYTTTIPVLTGGRVTYSDIEHRTSFTVGSDMVYTDMSHNLIYHVIHMDTMENILVNTKLTKIPIVASVEYIDHRSLAKQAIAHFLSR